MVAMEKEHYDLLAVRPWALLYLVDTLVESNV